MDRSAVSLGRFIGIPIGLVYSWFLIIALLIWSFAIGYSPAEHKNWPTTPYRIVSAAAVAFGLAKLISN